MSAATAGAIPAADVRAKIDDILARPEFGHGTHPIKRWIEDLIRGLERLLSEFFGISLSSAGSLLVYLVYAGLAIALGLIVWRVVTMRRLAEEAQSSLDEHVDPVAARRARVRDLRRRAREARAGGDRVLALRLYFTALVVGLGEKGDLEYRDAWTNRELLERGEPKLLVERALAPLVPALDRHSFGGEPTSDDDVGAMARVVDELLGAESS